ncbi:carboxypeptidase regulatory-like domain-containing protein [Promicromonospora sp. NPDC050880]|uniref:carboxypeptidase regulatory-like domain-containing protein n=1 Tax=Promicromonospora sp. NPDC050880 TaxID=3364406 RepID=UPI0037B0A8AC
MKRSTGGLGVLAAAVLVALSAVAPTATSAATTADWADWEPLTGSAGDWSTTMQVPAAGFPAATVTSDSRGGVGVISGASSWLSAATPPGEVFGSSRGQQYLNLRPQADRPTAPSTTTYTFERPTPAAGWAFVLGDIDADRAVVTALDPDGRELSAAELGWQGGFNYCAAEGAPSCTGDPADVPAWDPATRELIGNAAANDTSGAAGWFRPTTPISSLTVEFFQRSGFPVYQTWFASLARDIAGTVDLVDASGAPQGVLPGATLTLFGPDGTELATTTSDDSGQYGFPGYTTAPGYRVELTTLPEADDAHPYGLVPYGERVVADIDLTDADATGVDFAARDIVPVVVSGTVLTEDGEPVPGATVTLTPVGGGTPRTAVTDSTGAYLVDNVGWDAENGQPQEYTFTLSDLPDGFVVGTVPDSVTVEVDQEEPSTGNDFVVRAPASVSGTVTSGGEPVAGAVVRLEGPGGTVTTTTAADGTYRFDDVLAGDHVVSVEAPDGYRVDGPATQDVTVGSEDVTGVDFALTTPGTIGGTVTDDAGEPVAGATVTVAGPDGPVELVTDAEGGYFAGDLPPGDYTITLTVPEGYTAGTTERSVTVTDAGENWLTEDFEVSQEPVEPQDQPVGGTVTDTDGSPVPGVEVVVTDGDGQTVATATTDDEGTWGAELPTGSYTAVVQPGEGHVVEGEDSIAFEVTDAAVSGLDFVLSAAGEAPSPGPGPDPDPSSAPSAEPAPGTQEPGDLAATGATVGSVALAAGVLLALGVALVRGSRRMSAARTRHPNR